MLCNVKWQKLCTSAMDCDVKMCEKAGAVKNISPNITSRGVTAESSKYTYFVQSETCPATQTVVQLLMISEKNLLYKCP